MKVLLTRPEGRNQSMVDALDKRGVAHWVTPLLCVSATPSDIDQQAAFQEADIHIFISTNAVTFALEQLKQPWPQSTIIAVGQATKEALALRGIDAQTAPEDCQQTEGLLTLAALSKITGKKVVIVRGRGGREVLAEQLVIRGAQVSYWEVYQRGLPALDGQVVCQQWKDFGIDTIVITSGEILENLIELVPKELFAWLRACHIIVPSIRVEAQALACGMAKVTNASAANSQAVLAALKL